MYIQLRLISLTTSRSIELSFTHKPENKNIVLPWVLLLSRYNWHSIRYFAKQQSNYISECSWAGISLQQVCKHCKSLDKQSREPTAAGMLGIFRKRRINARECRQAVLVSMNSLRHRPDGICSSWAGEVHSDARTSQVHCEWKTKTKNSQYCVTTIELIMLFQEIRISAGIVFICFCWMLIIRIKLIFKYLV